MKALLTGLKHLKTTLAGVAAICAGLGMLAPELTKIVNGEAPDLDQAKLAFAAIAAGAGLIFAKDADKSNAPEPTASPVSTSKGFGTLGLMLALALVAGLALAALPARAQEVDPTTSTIDAAGAADEVAQSAPDIRFSVTVWKVTFAPAVSTVPVMLSLNAIKDGSFKTTLGPNIGGGLDITAPNGYGGALHLLRRDTGDGAKPLLSLAAIIPELARRGLRPVVSYQRGGGATPWEDGLSFGLAGASNFGYTSGR